MIQIVATSRNAILPPAAPAPGGDAAAFGLSLAAMSGVRLDTPGQPVAVPGKPLPPTPVAPVSAAPSGLDPGVEPVAPMAATVGLVETRAKETPASASAVPLAAARVKPGAVAIRVPQQLPTGENIRRIEANPRPTPVRAPDPALPAPLPVPLDDLHSQPVEARGSSTVVDVDKLIAVPNPALTANRGDTVTLPTDLARASVAAPPSHPPRLAPAAAKVAPDPPIEPGEVSHDDPPKGSADLAPAAPATPILIGTPVLLDATAAMPVAVSLMSPHTHDEAPISTDPAPGGSVVIVASQRTDASPPVADDAPARPMGSTDPLRSAPPPDDHARAFPATAPAPAAVSSVRPQQPIGERPRAVSDRQAVARPVDPTVVLPHAAIPSDAVRPAAGTILTRGPDAVRPTQVAPSPDDGERRYEAVAAVRPVAVASSLPRVDTMVDSEAPTTNPPIKRAPSVAPPMASGVEPARGSPMATTAAAAPIADAPSPTASAAPPLPYRADVSAALVPPQMRGVAAVSPLSSLVPVERDAAVALTTGRVDSAPAPAPVPAAASAPAQPVSPVPTASTLAPPPPAIAQLAATPAVSAPAARPEDSPRSDATAARAPAPVTLVSPPRASAPLIAAGTTAPAFRLFAEAIHAARRDERTGDPLAPAPVATIDPARAALPVGGAALDMTDRRWPHAMIDRIEALRDAASAGADAADTSIRLVPASLGAIDVAVRRDGDTVHVHFNAEQAATRALLTEAQPRLAELAESRGLKLGQASVGAGADQNAQRQPAQQPARIATAPAPAVRDDETDIATTRVA